MVPIKAQKPYRLFYDIRTSIMNQFFLTFLLRWKVIKLLHKYILWFMTLTIYESAIGKHLTFPCIMSDSLWVNIRPTYILACLFILHLHKDLMRGITNKYPSFCKNNQLLFCEEHITLRVSNLDLVYGTKW